jgi:hypothetical protein
MSIESWTNNEAARWEQELWQQAEQVSTEITGLEEKAADLYGQISILEKGNLHEREQLLPPKDAEYWKAQKRLDELKQRENNIQLALEQVSAGTMTADKMSELLTEDSSTQALENSELSKKKRALLEEKKKLLAEGIDDYLAPLGNGVGTHLSTGRHAKRVTVGNNTMDPAGDFFAKTADTHGGKVAYGKGKSNINAFTTAKGTKIRKK